MKTVLINDVPVSYVDEGEGYPVVLLHSSGSSHHQWRGLIDSLSDRYRVIAPDFHGHGDTPLPGEIKDLSITDDVYIIQAIAGLVGEPFHLVGHSYGGAIALQAAREMKNLLLSLTLVEPAAFFLLRRSGETAAWREIFSIAVHIIQLVERGKAESGAEQFISYWWGPEAWGAMAEERRQAVIECLPGIGAIFGGLLHESTPVEDYGQVEASTLLLRGARTTLAASRVTELLEQVLPNKNLVEIEDAGHMAPVTHSAQVNEAISAHLDQQTFVRWQRSA